MGGRKNRTSGIDCCYKCPCRLVNDEFNCHTFCLEYLAQKEQHELDVKYIAEQKAKVSEHNIYVKDNYNNLKKTRDKKRNRKKR